MFHADIGQASPGICCQYICVYIYIEDASQLHEYKKVSQKIIYTYTYIYIHIHIYVYITCCHHLS